MCVCLSDGFQFWKENIKELLVMCCSCLDFKLVEGIAYIIFVKEKMMFLLFNTLEGSLNLMVYQFMLGNEKYTCNKICFSILNNIVIRCCTRAAQYNISVISVSLL